MDPFSHLRVLLAAVSSADASALIQSSGKDAFSNTTKYDYVAAVLRQCDNQMSSTSSKSLSSMSVKTFRITNHRNNRSQNKKLSPQELTDLKENYKCNSFGMFGHWPSEYNQDGSLPPTVRSTAQPSGKHPDAGQSKGSGTSADKKTIKFNMASLAAIPHVGPSNVQDISDVSPGAI